MEEKIYLTDWLYNAGIVGFRRILEASGDKKEIEIGNDYISFHKEILTDFDERYFSYAYPKADSISNKIERLKGLISSGNEKEGEIKKYIKRITASNTIKKDAQVSALLEKAKISNDWKSTAEDLIKHLPSHWETNKNLYLKYYLQRFYEGKSIFNPAIKGGIKEGFKRDFIDPLFETRSKRGKIHYCKVCNQRVAKKGVFFDEGAFKLTGASEAEYKNFYWNLVPNTHLCGICELIYLCSFAGFSNLSTIGESNKYLFVNLDTTVDDIYKINNTVENFVLSTKENPFKLTIRNILLDYEKRRSRWTLGNILFVEFDTEKAPYTIHHFHIPKYIAMLFEGNSYKDFEGLEGFYYKDNDKYINVLAETIDNLLAGISIYKLLNKVIGDLLKGKHYRRDGLFNLVAIQSLLNIYKKRREEMQEKVTKTLWSLYYEGNGIANELRKKNQENKIDSIAYKLLSALRVRDTKSFYDILLRLYMNLEKEVPGTFVESLSPDSILAPEAIGYAFLTGLLGREKAKQNTEKKEDKEDE